MIVNESLVVHEVRTDVGDDIVAFINGDKVFIALSTVSYSLACHVLPSLFI
jgi:hypothetical protein